jgi:hypothetical protein
MNKSPNSTPRADEGPANRDGGRTGNEDRVGQGKTHCRSSRSGAGARECPQPGSPPAPFRIRIHPFHGPAEGVDVTDALVGAIALVLWRLHGGNEPVNRLEALVLLERAMGRTVARARSNAPSL